MATLGSLAATIAVLFVAGLFSSVSFPLTTASIEPRQGRTLFQERCSGCHSLTPDAAGGLGPNLAKIGAIAATRRPDMSAASYLLESLFAPNAYSISDGYGEMPEGLVSDVPPSSVRALLAFLLSMGGTVDAHELMDLDIPAARVPPAEANEDPSWSLALARRGQKLFEGDLGCSGCHAVHTEVGTGIWAPNLSRIGLMSIDYVRTSIRDPGADIASGYGWVDVSLVDGEVESGWFRGQEGDLLKVFVPAREAFGPALRSIPLSAVADDADGTKTIRRRMTSSMPPYRLPSGDEDALVAFLMTLRR